ncbi:family 16 glycosylhydrolase [Paenibacillus amylolyticus]|uniref:Family 16 glycosylhydrolase n=1 Tax=Paenibacillus amylolyticus TaxID=1451 RepID=A0A5M9WQ50_PAEAM|nr:carbohydrate binding domain-containing protein [Paenibacillus amylolyticus]KAA8783568.1 family 16 glycosylhydrolase [Paenibacillus amylolyticus]
MKKGLACLVAGSMIVSLAAPAVVGAEQMKQQTVTEQEQASSLLRAPYKDLQGHWAEKAVMRLQDMALTKGYADGTFRPSERISRAEFVVMLDRVFGFAGGPGAASYTDVSEKDWYYDAITRASGSGIIQGTDATHLSPQLPITRQDAVVMADRAFQLSTGSESLGTAFKDDKDVADYARNAMNYFVNNKFVNGYNGNLAPESNITRAEAATIMSTLIADIKSKPGTYESKVEGNLIIRSTDVTLKNTTVNGNLLLTEAIGEGTVRLDGVTVTGSVIVKGGGNHSIDIHNSKLNRVVVDKNTSPVHVEITGATQVEELFVENKATVELSAEGTINSLKVNRKARNTAIDSKGRIKLLEVDASNVLLNGKAVAPGQYKDNITSGTGQSEQPNAATPGTSNGGTGSSSGGGGSSNSGGTTPSVPGIPSGEKPIPATTIPDEHWEMVWNDEFNAPSVDASKWTVQDTELVYNNELQYYSPNNTRIVKDGNRNVLQIEAKREQKGSKNYTSGKLITKEKGDWTYGKVVVRAKLPIQQGMWPAIWMMPTDEAHYGGWPASGEIDIMELIGGKNKDHEIYSTIHYDSKKADGSHGHDQGKFTLPQGESFADDYHDFQVEWLPGMIRFYVDGKLHHQINNWQTTAAGQPESYTFPAPFDRPFYLILNLAVGGDWPGSPENDFVSEKMNVDFVRVYSYKNMDQWPDVTSSPIEPEKQRAPQADGNQIYNEKFIQGVDTTGVPADWNFITNAGGEGKVEVVEDEAKGKAAKVTISKAGTETYSVQLTQMPMYIKKDKKYKVEFDAKASANRVIRSKVTQFEKSWTNYSEEKAFSVTTDWQPYEYEFNMRNGSDNNARFEFNLGLNEGEVSVTNVRLTEIGEADPLPVERKALPDGNYVFNGTFDQGKQRLGFWNTEIQSGAEAQVSVNNFLKFPIMERQLVVDVKKTNGQPAQVAVTQPGMKLEGNTTYGFSFDAKADTTGVMDIGLSTEEGHNVQMNQGQQIQIGSEMKTYTGEIVIGEGAATATSELKLLFGGSTGKLYVDNVRLTKRGKPVAIQNYTHIPAADAYVMQGLQLENSDEGGEHVSYMDEGDLLQFKITAANDGAYAFSTRMASAKDDAKVRFTVKDEEGHTVASSNLTLGDTGGWQTYKTVYFPSVSLKAGTTYYVNFEGNEYNTRWLDISRSKVKNGELSSVTSDWMVPASVTTVTYSDDQGISLTVPSTTQNWWDAILQQGQLTLEAGKTYRLSFDASASVPKPMQVVVSKTGSDDVKYLEQAAELTTTKQPYAYTFTMGDTEDEADLLNFGLGHSLEPAAEHVVSIQNVMLFEVNPGAEEGGQPVHVNLIKNGDFTQGTNGWFPYAASNKPEDLVLSAENQQLQARIGQVGENAWDRQLIQEGFAMQQGYTYKLSFKAKADKTRKLGVGIGWVDIPANYKWTGFYGNQMNLMTEEQQFTFTFQANEASYTNSRIVFDMGKIDGTEQGDTTITLSDVKLVNMGKTQ